jgi:predicted RNA-binding protein (virulence factor B family)
MNRNQWLLMLIGFVIPVFFAAKCDGNTGICETTVGEENIDLSSFVLKDTLYEVGTKASWILYPDAKDNSLWTFKTKQAKGTYEFRFRVTYPKLDTIKEKMGAKN